MWGIGAYPMTSSIPYDASEFEEPKEPVHGEESSDSDLRSTQDIRGHDVQALNCEIGHVEDFILDDETWAIRYLVIDSRRWFPGKKVLISPQWIDRVSWSGSKVFVGLLGETVRNSPEYTDESLLDRDYEARLHDYYSRRGYWDDEQDEKKH